MTPQTCRQCGHPITASDYFVAGIEADTRGIPTNVYTHRACRSAYAQAEQQAAGGKTRPNPPPPHQRDFWSTP